MKICITGKKNSGKTTFINFLKEKFNNNVYITDDYIHEIYKKNKIGFNFILNEFGSEYIKNDEVDRKKLNELILKDQTALKKLNDFSIKIIQNWIESLEKDCFVELGIYLININEFKNYFDKVILIKNDNIIIDNNHISKNLEIDKKIKFDYIIYNNNSIEEFKKNIYHFCKK